MTSLRYTPLCYLLLSLLDEWEIPYQVLIQGPGEVAIIYPEVYHQDFNAGFNVCAAVNLKQRRPGTLTFSNGIVI